MKLFTLTMWLVGLLICLAPTTVFSHASCGNGSLQPNCAPVIPSNAINVDANTTINSPIGVNCYWVCSGIILTLNGVVNSQIYLEENATLSLLGGENYVFIPILQHPKLA